MVTFPLNHAWHKSKMYHCERLGGCISCGTTYYNFAKIWKQTIIFNLLTQTMVHYTICFWQLFLLLLFFSLSSQLVMCRWQSFLKNTLFQCCLFYMFNKFVLVTFTKIFLHVSFMPSTILVFIIWFQKKLAFTKNSCYSIR